MRLFFAVHVSDAIKNDIADALKAFPVRNPPWRWIVPENLHVTLKFLGEMDESALPDLGEVARHAASGIKPFRIVYGPFGGFPALSRPRVIFFEATEGLPELARLAAGLESGAELLGVPRENRPFTAHLTLARIKEPLPAGIRDALQKVPPLPASASQTVEHFSLMQSRLSRAGAEYEELERFDLV
jgi:RNA 2',3'-cyclic 3'-phosphodiesterase